MSFGLVFFNEHYVNWCDVAVYNSFVALGVATEWCVDANLSMGVVNSSFEVFGDLGIMEHGRFGWWGVVDGGVNNERWIMVVVIGVCRFKQGKLWWGKVLKGPPKAPHYHINRKWNEDFFLDR